MAAEVKEHERREAEEKDKRIFFWVKRLING
jgi:hypothetical protein